MSNCDNCGSDRIAAVGAKCSDLGGFAYKDIDYHGYVPCNLAIGGDDYVAFQYCLECGKIQGKFPITDEQVNAAFEDSDDDDWANWDDWD